MNQSTNKQPGQSRGRQTVGYVMRTALLISVTGITALGPVSPAFAQTPEQLTERSLFENWHEYVPGDSPLGVPCGAAGGGEFSEIPLHGNDNIERAFHYFVDRSLTPQQSAGIVANLIVESGVDPLIVQNGGRGPGHGIAQWEDSRGSGRWDTLRPVDGKPRNLIDWAAGRPPLDLGTQLDFLWYELNEFYAAVLGDIRNAPSEGEAAFIFMSRFEIPADRARDGSNDRKRRALATQVLQKYGGGAGGGGAIISPVTSNCSGAIGGGIGVGEIVFPLITTKSALTGNRPNWCFQNQANCHHHYNAADIFTPPGTQVIAAAAGEVKRAAESDVAARVGILGDDGRFYFYQHLARGSLKVHEGQRVAAQEPLAVTGDRRAAFNTDPHLHFDMQPPPARSRPDCKGGGCQQYNFLNVQPALISAYQNLPN